MACSGIAEHNEARRKDRRMENKAFLRKQTQARFDDDINAAMMFNNTSYEDEIIQKALSPSNPQHPRPSDRSVVDQQRRDLVRRQEMVEYSAKLPKRFSSTDYKSQW